MRLASIVLAAGRSRRFGGGNKLLAEIGGSTVLRQTVTAITAAGFDPTLVVTGQIMPVAALRGHRVTSCRPKIETNWVSIAAGVASSRRTSRASHSFPATCRCHALHAYSAMFAVNGGGSSFTQPMVMASNAIRCLAAS